MGSTFSTTNNVVVCLDRLIYNPGETVTGAVLLNILEEMGKFKDLEVEAYGEEETKWSETTSRSVTNSDGSSRTEWETRYYGGKKRVFELKRTLHRWDPSVKVQPGRYVFPFSFTLPADAEPTEHHVEGECHCLQAKHPNRFGAHMRWVVAAEANRSGKDLKAATELTVVGPTQLSPMWLSQPAPAVRDDVDVKRICCCWPCGSRGFLSMSLKANKAAYTGGEVVEAEIEVLNGTDEHFRNVTLSLEVVGWASTQPGGSGPRTSQTGTLATVQLPGFKPRKKQPGPITMTGYLQLPDTLPRRCRQLSLFGFRYRLVLKAVAGVFSSFPSTELPLHLLSKPGASLASMAAPSPAGGAEGPPVLPAEAPAWWQPTAIAAGVPLDPGVAALRGLRPPGGPGSTCGVLGMEPVANYGHR